eukprot:9123126-Ditylum_brightwellii.AAC.1
MEELDHIVIKHPQYEEFCSCTNHVGLYMQRQEIKNLRLKDGERHKYRFYWCCNENENCTDMDSWYCGLDKYSFMAQPVKYVYDSTGDDNHTEVDKMIVSGKLSVNPRVVQNIKLCLAWKKVKRY